jgi:hypothetical protein
VGLEDLLDPWDPVGLEDLESRRNLWDLGDPEGLGSLVCPGDREDLGDPRDLEVPRDRGNQGGREDL